MIVSKDDIDQKIQVIRNNHRRRIMDTFKLCFKEFSMTIDGTPTFVEAEAFKFRQVSHDFEVYHFLVYVAMLKDSPNAEKFAKVIEQVVCSV